MSAEELQAAGVTRVTPGPPGPRTDAAGWEESHQPAWPAATPLSSRSCVEPSPNRIALSAGLPAAAALLITSTSCRPLTVAVMARSTPGKTSGYVAVEPESVGSGRAPA